MTSRPEQACSIGDSRYLIAPKQSGWIPVPEHWSYDKSCLPLLATVIRVDGVQIITPDWLQKTIDDMLASDDVLCKNFLSHIIFFSVTQYPMPEIVDENGAFKELWPRWGFFSGDIRPGPYFLVNSTIHQAFKLYPDPNGAFMYGVIRSEDRPER